MKIYGNASAVVACSLVLIVTACNRRAPAPDQSMSDEAMNVFHNTLAEAEFSDGFPTEDTTQMLNNELYYQRAVQVYLWSLPAVNLYAMKEGSEKAYGAGYNVLPVWKERLNAQTRVTTPDSDCVYAMGFIDLAKDGPTVVEVPPHTQGILDDFFQRPLTGPTIKGTAFTGNIGFPGPDAGNGARYLIVPWNYKGLSLPGVFVYRSRTNNVLVALSAFFADPHDLGPPNQAIAGTRIYPFGKQGSALPMAFPDGSRHPSDLLFPHDASYFDLLAQFVQSETVDPADMDWRGMMAAIGINKGRPFQPTAYQRHLLDQAAKTAFNMSKVSIYAGLANEPGFQYYPDRQWVNALAGRNGEFQSAGTFTNLVQRIANFTTAYSAGPAIINDMFEKGAKQLFTWRDSYGNYLTGGDSYQLHLPPNIPVANFWSVTVYDALDATGLRNQQPFPSLNAMDKPTHNADGSCDIYFGPTPPAGKERNWIQTLTGRGYLVILRLYSPQKPFFDQTWKPDDLQRIEG